jgi:ATP-dependent helicase/nuclease subunit A
MRLLYVAFTRARDMLVLTGTATKKDEVERWRDDTLLTDQTLTRATNYLEWLRLWFVQVQRLDRWRNERHGANAILSWSFYDAQDPGFAIAKAGEASRPQLENAPSSQELQAVRTCAAFSYAHAAATIEPAKTSVSALRRRAAERDEDARPMFLPRPAGRPRTRTKGLSAAEIGTAHHAFMQFVKLEHTGGALDLRNEAARLQLSGALSAEEVAVLDFVALANFWQSDVGRRFHRQPPAQIHREMPFTARVSAKDLRELSLPLASPGLADDEFMVIQGVVDLALITPQRIWLLDFKTDDVTLAGLPGKLAAYRPQLQLYALALSRIYQRPVAQGWLHFFALNQSVQVVGEV